MRKLLAAGLLALPFGMGCAQVGGVCDCAPVPGDSVGYNPHVTYHCTCPIAKVIPPPASQAPADDDDATPISTKNTGGKPAKADKPAGKTAKVGETFEPIGPPKTMPKRLKS